MSNLQETAYQNIISMTRGDNESFEVGLYEPIVNFNPNKPEYTKIDFTTGDQVTFTVKKDIYQNKDSWLIQKVVGTFTDKGTAIFDIEPIDTSNLPYGEYVYDVELFREGLIKTIIKVQRDNFVLTGEVT